MAQLLTCPDTAITNPPNYNNIGIVKVVYKESSNYCSETSDITLNTISDNLLYSGGVYRLDTFHHLILSPFTTIAIHDHTTNEVTTINNYSHKFNIVLLSQLFPNNSYVLPIICRVDKIDPATYAYLDCNTQDIEHFNYNNNYLISNKILILILLCAVIFIIYYYII